MPTGKRVLTRGNEGFKAVNRRIVTVSSGAPRTTCELVIGFDELMNKATTLSALLEATNAPATARWLPLVCWMRHNPKLTPWSVLVYRDRQLVSAAVLARSFRRGIVRFETMGDGQLPSSLPSRDAGSARDLAGAVGERLRALPTPWILNLRHLEIGDPVVGAIKCEFPASRTEQGVSPRLDFRTGEPLTSYLSRNTRSALAKARNRIHNGGLVSELTWTTRSAEIDTVVPEILDLYQERTIQLKQNVALLADPAYRRFFADMVHAYAEDGVVRLLTFRLNQKLVSYAMCLESAGTLFVYSNRMSPDGAKYSAGTITNSEVVRMAHSDPTISCVDWGTGLQRYKLSGEVTLHPHEDVDVWPSEPVYRAWVWAQRVREIGTRVAPHRTKPD